MNTPDNSKLKVTITTFGCQMNMYDTEVAQGLLEHAGYQIVHEYDSAENATDLSKKIPFPYTGSDIVLMNTCSVREHAEDRVYGRLGRLGKEKRKNPNLIVGLMGCMVEEHKEKLFKRFPELDLMVGTRNINDLPALIDGVRKRRGQVSKIKQDGISIEYTNLIKRSSQFHAWLPIMTGCDKVCTYCIVPITRGSEVSMLSREVYREASRLVAEGVKWITLLGQNVNSYHGEEPGKPPVMFTQLLDELCKIDGLERLSFTTSHPQDATPELFEVIARNPKISRHFHLPLQSGSDQVLKRMKRLHTYQEFKGKIFMMKNMIPGISVTTDIISGFSGETDEDHEATIRALCELKFDSAFIYKYSLRGGTPAAKLPDDVPIEIKDRRNQDLLLLQKRITLEHNQALIGKEVVVFAEGRSPKHPEQLVGRTNQEKRVVFEADKSLIGTFQRVQLKELKNETFIGQIVSS